MPGKQNCQFRRVYPLRPSTHRDLEDSLRLAVDLGAGLLNVHFEDRFADGAMVFDYRLRPGVVPTSNGLALLRAVGIDV